MKSRTAIAARVAARSNVHLLSAHVSDRDHTTDADKEVRLLDAAIELFDTPAELFFRDCRTETRTAQNF